MRVSTQSPGHITGFFVIYPNGSTGAGINIEGGMRTSIAAARKDSFMMNGKKRKLIVSEKTVDLFRRKTGKKGKVAVKHSTKFPIGYGLGISGAGALSLSIALNKLFGTGLAKNEMLEIAKRAEIECGTGLGDVVAEQFAGIIVGKKPYPSKSAHRINTREKYVALGFFRPMATRKIIRSAAWKRKINRTGMECMRAILNGMTVNNFMRLSRRFTVESGLGTRQILMVMGKEQRASMSMLGETVFMPAASPKKARKELGKYCKRTMIARIARKGACLL